MKALSKQAITCGFLSAVILGSAACSPKPIPHLSVDDLMEDRVTLDGVLLKCDQDPSKARNDVDCFNARIAVDRLAARSEPGEEAKRNQEFERSRERLRLSQDQQRLQQEAKTKVDAYSLPVVPVDPVQTDPQPPTAGQAKP